ncbi:MAG: flagellar biosynthesis protein FlgN [Treponema bryantii]|nr:flagellar biosynthesis protein FlgN [Treponema bryantii]MBR6583375.1 flagellar biosynthesis protein FlgN [Treponema sp.]
MEELSNQELEERVAILKRLRFLLEQQRSKFKEYLTVLEKQQNSIDKEDSEALIKHSELEQQIVKNISNLQKVIIPMNKMYSTINGSSAKTQNDSEIEKIQNELSDLQSKVLRQNEINRDLLRVHIENIKRQINNFKNPYKNNRSVYAQSQKVAQLVEINV